MGRIRRNLHLVPDRFRNRNPGDSAPAARDVPALEAVEPPCSPRKARAGKFPAGSYPELRRPVDRPILPAVRENYTPSQEARRPGHESLRTLTAPFDSRVPALAPANCSLPRDARGLLGAGRRRSASDRTPTRGRSPCAAAPHAPRGSSLSLPLVLGGSANPPSLHRAEPLLPPSQRAVPTSFALPKRSRVEAAAARVRQATRAHHAR